MLPTNEASLLPESHITSESHTAMNSAPMEIRMNTRDKVLVKTALLGKRALPYLLSVGALCIAIFSILGTASYSDIDKTKSEIEQTKSELSDLKDTVAALTLSSNSTADLSSVRAELHATQVELHATQVELQSTRAELASLTSSTYTELKNIEANTSAALEVKATQSQVAGLAQFLGRWEWNSSMSTERVRFGVGVLNGEVYAVGGMDSNEVPTDSVERYGTGAWSDVRPMSAARIGHAVAVLFGELYAIGGVSSTTGKSLPTVEKYNPGTNTWTDVAPMNIARQSHAAAVQEDDGGHIFVAGGCTKRDRITPTQNEGHCYGDNGELGPLSSVEMFHASTGNWTFIKPMSIGRCGFSLVAAPFYHGGLGSGTTLYAFGGYTYEASGFLMPVSSAEYHPVDYSIRSINWTAITPMQIATANAGAAYLNNGMIFVIGGHFGYSNTYGIVQMYHLEHRTWTAVASLPTPRCYLEVGVLDGKIFAVGGMVAGGSHRLDPTPTSSVVVYST